MNIPFINVSFRLLLERDGVLIRSAAEDEVAFAQGVLTLVIYYCLKDLPIESCF